MNFYDKKNITEEYIICIFKKYEKYESNKMLRFLTNTLNKKKDNKIN